MKCNKLKILLVLLILIMSIGMVSANESVSTDADVNNGNEQLAIDQGLNTDVDLLSDSGATATFTDLEIDIKSSQQSGVVNLNRDYKYDYSEDSSLRNGISVSRLTINGNNHTIDGSGLARIFTQYGGHVTINDVNFVNGRSSSDSNGGAILVSSGNLTVNRCTFDRNTASNHGGAIGVSLITSASQIRVYNSIFTSNTAEFNGGSIYARNLMVDNSTFDSNRVMARYSKNHLQIEEKGLGGAIFAAYSTIKNSEFRNNKVFNPGEYQIDEGGGAIASINQLTVYNSVFENNVGFKGGAIFAISDYDSALVPSNFVKVYNSKFIANSAYSAGAICSNFNLTVDNSLFDRNNATGYGGGAINTGFKSNNNYFTNSNFTNNEALNYGGALSTSNSHINNCIFKGNKARHGGAIFSLSFDIKNSKFINNVATEGKNIIVIDGFTKDSKTKISESDVVVYNQNKVHDYIKDILDGHSRDTHYIPTGEFAGYQVYCVEEHLFRPENTEGVLIGDLSYIVNSIDRSSVDTYLKVMFYLLDAYPENYTDFNERDIQTVTWIFTDGDYLNSRSNKLVNDVLNWYNYNYDKMNMTENTYYLPNGEKMEYDMKLFLTPADRQNMVLFKSKPYREVVDETVIKETINATVLVGENVQFKITVTNNGNVILDSVFVKDVQYSNGLKFETWYTDVGNWTYDGHGKWLLNQTLRVKQSASFIVEFSTSELGVLENNVTSGNGTYTLSNATNTTKTLPNPEMSVRKISNNRVVYIGQPVSFRIVVKNTGKYDITGLYVIDREYSVGLAYDYYLDPTNSWDYDGTGRWDYKGVLKVGEECDLVIFFIGKTLGLKINNVIAGNNQTNRTVNSTNHTKVINKTHHRGGGNRSRNETPQNRTNVTHHSVRYDKNATGNPLFALILVLISLKVVTFRRLK